jgi:hypothetical protein
MNSSGQEEHAVDIYIRHLTIEALSKSLSPSRSCFGMYVSDLACLLLVQSRQVPQGRNQLRSLPCTICNYSMYILCIAQNLYCQLPKIDPKSNMKPVPTQNAAERKERVMQRKVGVSDTTITHLLW